MTTPLKLKSERVGKVTLTEDRPFLSVLVDTGVFHLDYEFDYSLPSKFSLQPGNWVSVPFHGRNCLGLIVSRSAKSAVSKVQPINRGVKGPFISTEHLKLYRSVAERWASPIFDVLRFVTKYKGIASVLPIGAGEGKRLYLQLSPNQSEVSAIKEIAIKSAKSGSTLVIAPEARLAAQLESAEYEVAMRGAILSPHKYTNVIVVREDSEHHFEIKSPGFNTRDVALLRNQFLQENILFLGYSPSLEMARLIESGFISFKKSSGKVTVTAKPSQQGELIPSSLIKNFKNYLGKGPILVIAPNKGYGLAISCAACRNIAKCSCGGKLTKISKSAPPTCVICASIYQDWRCSYCHKERIYLLGRGIEKIAEDFGRAFPNTEIHIATADKEIEGEVSKRSIVLATVGAAPNLNYAATLVLEGINLGSDMRSEERYLSTLFRYAASSAGNLMVVERDEHPVVNSLIKWNPIPYLNRLISDLAEADLPPSTRHILLKSEDAERIYTGFLAALRENRIPANSKIHNLGNGVISIFFTLKSAKTMLSFLYEFQKRRSMSGKPLAKVRIDPYLLG